MNPQDSVPPIVVFVGCSGSGKTTLLDGKERLQLVSDHPGELSPTELASQYMQGVDLVLVEGYKVSKGDKIEVVRAERATLPLADAR